MIAIVWIKLGTIPVTELVPPPLKPGTEDVIVPAVSVIAKENKTLLVVPSAKTIQLTAAANLHPYVVRVAPTTDIEGRSAATMMAKLDVKRIATIVPDYAYGRDSTGLFEVYLKPYFLEGI